MGSKNRPGHYDCYGNALPDEPMFILLGRDPNAPSLVQEWADQREAEINSGSRPESDRPMVIEARECAKQMKGWRAANDGAWRKPAVDTDIEARRLYTADCDNHPTIHSNRFAAWSELDDAAKSVWRHRAVVGHR